MANTIDGQKLMPFDWQEFTVEILIIQILMIHYCWSTIDSALLTINLHANDQVLTNGDFQQLDYV